MVCVALLLGGCVPLVPLWNEVVPEQKALAVRQPHQLPQARLPAVPPPPTVANPPVPVAPQELSLDEAIRIALQNSKVVRVLAGVTAVSSGRTIYDPAIANTNIDQERAAFDPTLNVRNNLNRTEQPQAVFDPSAPGGVRFTGTRVDQYDFGLGLSKRLVTGGTIGLEATESVTRVRPGLFPLNPQERSALTLSFTQPLLQGAGPAVNLAPIVIARINTERSYFQFKDSVQELVRGVIEGYWALVFARTDVWVRKQQVERFQWAFELAESRRRVGIGTEGDVAQARVSLQNFRANLIQAEANVLQREAALRNLLGLSASEPDRIIPTTPPDRARVQPKWDELLRIAAENRPDLIELKLILEADTQALIQANNLAQPRVDATTLYRWNGLEGETPSGVPISTRNGQFTDWTFGVNFSVPLGLRQGRAALRRSELLLARDQANLEQGLHAASHTLAGNLRNLAQFYEQYLIFRGTRDAAQTNLDQQLANFRAGRAIFLNVLLAITDWGNAVSSEAQALTQYNTELADLERQTGTILDTHGIRFSEERFQSIGPLGRLGSCCEYLAAVGPTSNTPRHPEGKKPAEEFFDLKAPSSSKLGGTPLTPDLPRPQPVVPERGPAEALRPKNQAGQ